MHISGPIHSRSNDRWIITVSRRLDDPQGNFAGVITATILVDHLQAFYDTFDIGRSGVIALDMATGTIIARSPYAGRSIGTDASGGRIFTKLLPFAPVGSFQEVSKVDGVEHVGSYRRVDQYPLVIIVSHGMDEVLADWWSDSALHLFISINGVVIMILVSLRVARQVERRRAAAVKPEIQSRDHIPPVEA